MTNLFHLFLSRPPHSHSPLNIGPILSRFMPFRASFIVPILSKIAYQYFLPRPMSASVPGRPFPSHDPWVYRTSGYLVTVEKKIEKKLTSKILKRTCWRNYFWFLISNFSKILLRNLESTRNFNQSANQIAAFIFQWFGPSAHWPIRARLQWLNRRYRSNHFRLRAKLALH